MDGVEWLRAGGRRRPRPRCGLLTFHATLKPSRTHTVYTGAALYTCIHSHVPQKVVSCLKRSLNLGSRIACAE